MSTYKSVGVRTNIWTFAFLLILKMASYNCTWRFENSLLETIYANDNLAFSPSNVYANLQFASTIAKGQTLQEIFNVVKESVSYDLPSDAIADLMVFYKKGKHVMKCLPKGYKRVLKHTDFGSISGTNKMNAWISRKTDRYITNITMPEMYSENTLMNLVSTIYINPQWRKPFTTQVVTSSKRLMLHQYNKFYYGNLDKLNAVAVVMKFYSSFLKMLVLMPNDDDVQRLSKNLRHVDISRIHKKLQKTYLSLYFPKIDDNHMMRSLIKPLKNTFGIKQVFTKKADFGKLKPCADDSYIKQFKHYGAMSTDLNGAHFIALTAVQWDIYDNVDTVEPADDDPLENIYSNSSDRAVLTDGELEKSAEAEDLNNATKVSLDRSLFYAVIFDRSILFSGTLLVTKAL